MMKILIAPNAFKGSLSASDAAQAIQRGLLASGLICTCTLLPLADGGDGMLDAFLATGGTKVAIESFDALQRPIRSAYGLLPDGTAVIEMAQASGLAQLRTNELDPLRASTYGTGLLMRAALEAGSTRMIVGLGGSATTDGGMGALQALGIQFFDAQGRRLIAGGGVLRRVARIDSTGLDVRWKSIDLVIATDVENPAVGENGAAYVFAPQKGASAEEVQLLDGGLRHFFSRVSEHTGRDVTQQPGSGAAGALAGGLLAFVGGRFESGAELVLRHHRIEDLLPQMDLVVTGEGRLDSQTLSGKGSLQLARRAQQHGIPVVILAGSISVSASALQAVGIHAALSIMPGVVSLEEAMLNASHYIEYTAFQMGRLMQLK